MEVNDSQIEGFSLNDLFPFSLNYALFLIRQLKNLTPKTPILYHPTVQTHKKPKQNEKLLHFSFKNRSLLHTYINSVQFQYEHLKQKPKTVFSVRIE